MKTAILMLSAAFTVPALSLSQQAAPSADPGAAAPAAAGHGSQRSSAAADAYMRPVDCELTAKLDSKTARTGDTVIAKTKGMVRSADGITIPKGAKLIGHVTNVQARTADQAESHISIAFDRAEWNGGSVHIHSIIESVSPPLGPLAPTGSDDSLSGPMGMGSGGRGMGATRGIGGVVGGTTGAMNQTASGAGSGLGSAGGDLTRDAGQLPAGANAGVNAVGTGAGGFESLSPRSTGVAGVMLQADASSASSGTLSASKHNVHLDSGTQITLGVTVLATAP